MNDEDLSTEPDLQPFEKQLASIPAPQRPHGRDDMLYQAGWNAALAQNASARPHSLRGFFGGSLIGAIAAAGLLLLSNWWIDNGSRPAMTARNQPVNQTVEHDENRATRTPGSLATFSEKDNSLADAATAGVPGILRVRDGWSSTQADWDRRDRMSQLDSPAANHDGRNASDRDEQPVPSTILRPFGNSRASSVLF